MTCLTSNVHWLEESTVFGFSERFLLASYGAIYISLETIMCNKVFVATMPHPLALAVQWLLLQLICCLFNDNMFGIQEAHWSDEAIGFGLFQRSSRPQIDSSLGSIMIAAVCWSLVYELNSIATMRHWSYACVNICNAHRG